MHILAYFLFAIYVAPVVMIVLFSFTDAATINSKVLDFSAFTLQNYINVFTNADTLLTIHRPQARRAEIKSGGPRQC